MAHPRDRWLPLIYAAAIFFSAFLLFQIQPLISKRILSWFGGTPAVWTTCLLFFQTVLFAGYAYAHWSNSHLLPRRQAAIHAVLILVALTLMHVAPSEHWEPSASKYPIPQILLILAASIGLPYFVLSATGPLLQAWFARTFPGRIPYRLYALSNIGSLLALATYPFFFEPTFDLPSQARFWTIGFIIYAILSAYLAWCLFSPSPSGRGQGEGAWKTTTVPATSKFLPTSPSPTLPLYLYWLFLAAFASLVLIATTNQISTDIAVMPLLWIAPLAIYLITFIIAFDRPTWYLRTPTAIVAVFAIYAAAVVHHFGVDTAFFYELGTIGVIASNFGDPNATPPYFHVGPVHFLLANLTALFAICLLCHGEISRSRPAPQFLTSFYLMISGGGALGAIFATLIAPFLFKTYFEWDAAMFLACLAAGALVVYSAVSWIMRRAGTKTTGSRILIGGTLLALLGIFLVMLIDVTEFLGSRLENVQWAARNFFGTLRVQVTGDDDPEWERHVLYHGAITHGAQYADQARRREPTTYYARTSGVGRTIDYFHRHLPPGRLRIGAIGLGAGTLAAYPERGESITFYEINPLVVELAEAGKWFTYLGDCRARGAHYDIRLGDARLTLKHELQSFPLPPFGEGSGEGRRTSTGPAGQVEESPAKQPRQHPSYHILALDAFSGDSIPTHLLTVQAFELYLAALAPSTDKDGHATESGAIAVHISNLYLDLDPVVRAAADHFQLTPLRFFSSEDPATDAYAADWIILTRNPSLSAEFRLITSPPETNHAPVLWTDDRSSLFEVLK
jgi:hypothetical protein